VNLQRPNGFETVFGAVVELATVGGMVGHRFLLAWRGKLPQASKTRDAARARHAAHAELVRRA
jgi:hypothetical protein